MKRDSLIYIHVDQVDVTAKSFLDFALAGCHIYARQDNLIFDEYDGVSTFQDAEDAVDMIASKIDYTIKGDNRISEHINKKHGLQTFQQSLKKTVIEMENYNV